VKDIHVPENLDPRGQTWKTPNRHQTGMGFIAADLFEDLETFCLGWRFFEGNQRVSAGTMFPRLWGQWQLI
jgi:hypothetical protein